MKKPQFQFFQVLALAFLLLIVIWVYFPMLQNGFTNWDDQKEILENPLIREFSLETIKTAFTNLNSRQYIPLTTLSLSLQHYLWGFDPFLFHLTDLFIHLLNIFLLYRFLFRFTHDFRISFLAATLFGLHPIQVETVSWILERRNLLYTTFFFASLTSWLDFSRKRTPGDYFLSFIFMLLSLFCKALAITLPVIFLLCDQRSGRSFTARRILEQLPFFLIAALFVAITLSGASFPQEIPASKRILLASYSMVFSLGKLLFPQKLSVIYPYPEAVSGSYPLIVYLSPFIIVFLMGILWRFRNNFHRFTFPGLFFLINFFPVSRIFPAGVDLIASDHLLYVPSVGLFLFFSEHFKSLYKRVSGFSRTALVILGFGLVITLGGLSHARTYVWDNSATLFEDAIGKYPGSPIPFNQLGLYYQAHGDWPTALRYYTQLVDLFPSQGRHLMIRGKAFLRAGLLEPAFKDFQKALEMAPENPEVLFHRGTAFLLQKKFDSANDDFTAVIMQNPEMATAYANQAWAKFGQGNLIEAIQDATKAIVASESHLPSLINRALFSCFRADFFSAITDFLEAWKRIKFDFPFIVRREIDNFFSFGPWDTFLLSPNNLFRIWMFFPGLIHLVH